MSTLAAPVVPVRLNPVVTMSEMMLLVIVMIGDTWAEAKPILELWMYAATMSMSLLADPVLMAVPRYETASTSKMRAIFAIAIAVRDAVVLIFVMLQLIRRLETPIVRAVVAELVM